MGKANIKVNTLAAGYRAKRKSTVGKVNTLANSYKAKHTNNGSALGYVGGKIGVGFAGIFEGIHDFTLGTVYQLMGDKEYAKYLHMNDVTGGWNERLDKNYNPSGTMRFVGDVSMALGQAIPSVAVGVATGGVGAVAGAIGSTAIGVGYAGRGVTDAVKQTGELGLKENIYGTLTGAFEGATDALLGGAQKAGKSLFTVARQSAKVGAKKVARNTLLKGVISSAGSEALEEFIQEYADTALLRLTGVNREAEYSLENAMYSALIGGISGGILGGASGTINSTVNIRRGEDIRARGLDEQLIKTADYVREQHLGNVNNWSNVTSDSLKALSASLDAYKKLADKSGTKAAMLLGEIKQAELAFEASAGVDGIKSRMMSSDEATRAELARTASALYGSEVTAEDIKTNKGDITRRIALESFVSDAMNESKTDMRRAQINEAIAAERLPYINQSAGWDGQSAAEYRDPKSGKYVFVEPSEDGTWRMAYSPTAVYDENNLMMKDGLDTEQVKKTLAGLADGGLVVGENEIVSGKAARGNVETENISATRRSIENSNKVVLNITQNSELANRIANSTDSKYKVIRDYLFETLGGQEFIMSDGRKAIMDKRDAQELAHNATEARTAQLGNLKRIIENAVYKHSVYKANHKKFSDFHYYEISVKYNGNEFNLWLNVGVGKNDKKNHIYSITNKKEEAPTNYGVARPVGYALQNASSTNSIPQNQKKSTGNAKKDNRKSLAGDEASSEDTAQDAQEGSQARESAESEQEGVSEAQRAAEAENAGERASEMSERERKRGYSDKEANAARALVKDFDVMAREKRLAIVEMMRSAEANGAGKSFMKHAAAMIGYWRKGLWIIADNKTSEKGFYQAFPDGTRLIVVKPNAKTDKGRSAINTIFVEELAHDIWDRATAKTKDALYKMATEGSTREERVEIRDEYRNGYQKRGLSISNEIIREEIFTHLIAKTLGNEGFLERFDITPGRMTAFKRSIKAVTRMAKCFFGKDKYLYSRCEKMARSLIRVMGEQTFNESIGKSGKRYFSSDAVNPDNKYSNIMFSEYAISSALYDALDHKDEGYDNLILVSRMPKYIVDKFGIDGDFYIYRDHSYENMVTAEQAAEDGRPTKRNNKKVHFHGLGVETMTEAILSLENPIMTIDDTKASGNPTVIMVLPVFGKNWAPLYAALSFYSDSSINGDFSRKPHIVLTVAPQEWFGTENRRGWVERINEAVKENRVVDYNKEKRTDLSVIAQHTRLGNITERSLNSSLSEFRKKVNSFREKNKITYSLSDNDREFDTDAFISQSMENGGMVEKSEAKSQTAEKKVSKAKPKTKAELEAELEKTKTENQRFKSKKLEIDTETARVLKEFQQLVRSAEFFKNQATHRKYTDGGTAGATILADNVITSFATFFAKRTSFQQLVHPSTREGFSKIAQWYTPDNPIFADGGAMNEFFKAKDGGTTNIFSKYQDDIADMIQGIADGDGQLSIQELRNVITVVRHVNHLYNTYDAVQRKGRSESAKAMAARGYEAQTAARKVFGEGGKDGGRIKRIYRLFKESYLYTVVTPEEVLRDLEHHVKDPVLATLYRDIRLGEAEAGKIRAEILTPITEFLAKKENKKFYDELKTPKFKFGDMEITTAQAVSIYETSKREHAKQRMYDPDNGIKIYDYERGEEVTKRVTPKMVKELYGQFDETTREYVKHIEDAMAACKVYKSDTDYKVMGYTNVIDGHYYPITTDPNYFAKDVTDIRQAMQLGEVVKNKSFNKNTVEGAQAPLFIEDSQRVLERHVGGISQYSGLFIPLQNFGKVYGAKFDPSISAEEQNRDSDIDRLRGSMVKKTSLKEYFNGKVWTGKDNKLVSGGLDGYLMKLFADIQHIKPDNASLIDRAVEFIRSGYVNSVFGLNAKIIFTQLASYPAAFRLIDADCLARAFGSSPFSQENVEAMDKYSKITLARQFEGSNAADGLIEKLSRWGKLTSAGIEFTDRNTIKMLYSACQIQIEKDGGAEVGSEANLRAAAELLDNVLLDTQTTFLMSDRSALARDKNEFAKMLSMFRNEAVKSFSNFYGSIGAYIDHKRLSQSDADYGEMLSEDREKIARNAAAYLGSSAVVAAVSIAFGKLRSAGKPEEEKEKIGAMIAEESVGMVFDLFPIFSDVVGFMTDGYAMDSIPLEVINDVLSSLRNTKVLFDPEATSEAKAKHLRDTSYTVGKVVGLPVRNAARIAETTVGIFNKPLAYKFHDKFDTSKSYKSDLDKALENGNSRLAQTIMSLWVSNKMTGKASEAAVDELTRLYALSDGEGNKIFKNPRTVPSTLSKKERARFMAAYSGADGAMGALLSSKAYKALDDAGKAQAIKSCYDVYYVKGQQACGLEVSDSGARISSALSELDENILYAVMGFAKAYKGENRKAHIVQYLISLGVGLKERDKYLAALGYKTE